jgi:hypothetical protein
VFGIVPGVIGMITHPEAKTPAAFFVTMGLLMAVTVGYIVTWFAQRGGAAIVLLGGAAFAVYNLVSGRFRYAWLGDLVVEVPSIVAAALLLSAALFLYGARKGKSVGHA